MAECMVRLTVLLLLVATRASEGTSPFFFGAPGSVVPQFYLYDTQMVAGPVMPEPGRTGPSLPCASEGFFPHPTNCARFYRCVDYAGTGQVFSRYEFQCPVGQMFLSVGKDTCVPGDCAGVVPLPVPPPYDPSAAPGTGPVGDDPGSYQPGPPPQPVDTGAATAGGAYPQPGSTSPTDSASAGTPAAGGAYPQPGSTSPTDSASAGAPAAGEAPAEGAPAEGGAPAAGGAYPQPGSTSPTDSSSAGSGGDGAAAAGGGYPQPGGGSDGGCPARYVQDPTYCNIYLRCPDDNNRYVCTMGTVFDQARQMCRLDDQEDVCLGKPMYSIPASGPYRSDFSQLVEGGPLQFASGQGIPTLNQGQTFPLFRQEQTFPSFRQEQTFPSFSQGQTVPSFSQGQTFPSFSQGQTFPSFSEVRTFPSGQQQLYSAPAPVFTDSAGVPQFTVPVAVGQQGTTFFSQPSYIVSNLDFGK